MLDAGFKSVVDSIVENANFTDEIWTVEFTPKEWSVVNSVVCAVYDYCLEGMTEYGWKYGEFVDVLEKAIDKLEA